MFTHVSRCFQYKLSTAANRNLAKMAEYIGTEWDYVLDSLLAQIKESNMRKFVYEHEFATMKTIIENSSDLLK